MDQSSDDEIAAMRAFNRFYTRQMGLLDESLLKSTFSLAESRVIYELAHRDGLVATDLVRDLGLDAGYLSRLLKKFRTRGLLTQTTSDTDARQTVLALTPAGREAFKPLNQASRDQIAAMLEHLAAGGAGEADQGDQDRAAPAGAGPRSRRFPTSCARFMSATSAGSSVGRGFSTPGNMAGTKPMKRW